MINTYSSNSNESEMKYLGIISSVNILKNQIVLSDFPVNLPSIEDSFSIKIGFSLNFSQEFIAESLVNHSKYLALNLKENIQSFASEFFVRKAVYTDFSNLSKKDKNLILPEDILGISIYNINNNQLIGIVHDVLLTPANQVWIVENEEYKLPIPFTPNVVKKIDLKAKAAYIDMIDGLLDLAELKNAPRKERVFKKRGNFKEK